MSQPKIKLVKLLAIFLVCFSLINSFALSAQAATAKEIDVSIEAALDNFYDQFKDAKKLTREAKGVLVFPHVFKAGFGIGGEYGEGALLIKGKTVDYYNTAAASLGFQIGAQQKSIVVIFMRDEALSHFRSTSGWKAGVDASIAVVAVGAGGAMDTSKLNEPILGFIFGQKGLMYNLTLEGAKFTKIKR